MANKELLKYAGLAFQIFATLSVAFFIGYKLDQWIGWHFPVLLILFPLLVIIALFYKILKDTNTKKDE